MKITTTCLIPFYNEGQRLPGSLENTTRIKGVDEIICIDDGSSDDGGRQAKKRFPQIRLVKLEKNAGKAAAVKKGLEKARGKNILMMDADYHRINRSEIGKAIIFFQKHQAWDMILLKNFDDSFFFKLCRTNVVTVGLRLIRKKDLEKILSQPLSRYQLEIGINDWMMKHQKKVGWLPAHYPTLFKSQKIGFLKGLRADLSMVRQQFSYHGLLWYSRHLMTFCHQKAI